MTKSSASQVELAKASLTDFLTEDELQVRLGIGRMVTASVFAHSCDPIRKRGTRPIGTRNCIIGCDQRLGDLRDHIVDRLRKPSRLFGYADLPPELRLRRGSRDVEGLIKRMQGQVILFTLLKMRDAFEIYPLDADWMISQSVADEVIKQKERVQHVKRDDHTWHGLPKRDRRRKLAHHRLKALAA